MLIERFVCLFVCFFVICGLTISQDLQTSQPIITKHGHSEPFCNSTCKYVVQKVDKETSLSDENVSEIAMTSTILAYNMDTNIARRIYILRPNIIDMVIFWYHFGFVKRVWVERVAGLGLSQYSRKLQLWKIHAKSCKIKPCWLDDVRNDVTVKLPNDYLCPCSVLPI